MAKFKTPISIPPITLLLFISTLISTIPQFFLGDTYDLITSQVATPKSLFLLTLSAFTHSPDILVQHFLGNILVLLVFGSIAESMLGSMRFAQLSLTTFAITTAVNYMHTESIFIGHGLSGVVWAYQIFYLVYLMQLYNLYGPSIFKQVRHLLGIALMVFSIFGIAILEVTLLKMRFFANFGQVLHLVSLGIGLFYWLLWRNLLKPGNKGTHFSPINLGATVALILLLILNAYGTVKVISYSI